MIDSKRKFGLTLRSRRIFGNQSGWRSGKNHRLQIVFFPIAAKKERCLFALAEGASQSPFINSSLLRRALKRKGVARFKPIIAKYKPEFAVIFRRARFGNYLDPPASGPRKFGRVRVLIDPNFLDPVGRNFPGRFKSVNQDGRAARPDRTRVNQIRHGPNHIIAKNRQIV